MNGQNNTGGLPSSAASANAVASPGQFAKPGLMENRPTALVPGGLTSDPSQGAWSSSSALPPLSASSVPTASQASTAVPVSVRIPSLSPSTLRSLLVSLRAEGPKNAVPTLNLMQEIAKFPEYSRIGNVIRIVDLLPVLQKAFRTAPENLEMHHDASRNSYYFQDPFTITDSDLFKVISFSPTWTFSALLIEVGKRHNRPNIRVYSVKPVLEKLIEEKWVLKKNLPAVGLRNISETLYFVNVAPGVSTLSLTVPSFSKGFGQSLFQPMIALARSPALQEHSIVDAPGETCRTIQAADVFTFLSLSAKITSPSAALPLLSVVQIAYEFFISSKLWRVPPDFEEQLVHALSDMPSSVVIRNTGCVFIHLPFARDPVLAMQYAPPARSADISLYDYFGLFKAFFVDGHACVKFVKGWQPVFDDLQYNMTVEIPPQEQQVLRRPILRPRHRLRTSDEAFAFEAVLSRIEEAVLLLEPHSTVLAVDAHEATEYFRTRGAILATLDENGFEGVSFRDRLTGLGELKTIIRMNSRTAHLPAAEMEESRTGI
eukprot:ANDGO_02813.mRNA.1 hypothetical protein